MSARFAALLTVLCICSHARADDRDDFFEAKIRPVLVGTCFRCHGDGKTSGALRVDSREALLKGGESGAVLLPGKPEESLLIRALRRNADVSAMPPEKNQALRPDQVADFVKWVAGGAAWPTTSRRFEATRHWSYEPVRDVPLPTVRDETWVQTSIDAFIRAKQESRGTQPAPRAEKLTLIRRATFDLTGLPPQPDEIEAFLQDDSPRAFATVVDRLLNSPAYGERWGRHWLDVVRYADTAGETADYPTPLAWKYRNYVIDAFNADKPYDEFLREQIAGDILAAENSDERYAERVTATGYLAVSRRFGFDSENYHHLTIQDTIDTLGQSILGLSLGCARCHDHKFDAVTMQDYYGLYGIFDSTRYPFPGSEQKQRLRALAPLVPPADAQPRWREYENQVARLSSRLTRSQQSLPSAVLRALSELDGDFELQAPASGGSKGVLVPPWMYEGPIAVTTAAQSPYKQLYPLGRVGVSISSGAGPYRLWQALRPAHHRGEGELLYLNLDFRVGASDPASTGLHRLTLGELGSAADAVELLISSTAISLKGGDALQTLAEVKSQQWQNLQLTIDLPGETVSGQLGTPTGTTKFLWQLPTETVATINFVRLDSDTDSPAKLPSIEYDNLGVQHAPLERVSTEPAGLKGEPPAIDVAAINAQLATLVGIDGDFELQTKEAPPTSPWGPGPNSVVKVFPRAQSPYQNLFAAGELGVHMPNRGEYDGFGLTLPGVKPDSEGRLFAAFDFRCASQEAGGQGSWRYYLGHGPGHSAAVELFFNGTDFFRRSADARERVAASTIGEWYQVQLCLDLKAKTYTGVLTSKSGETPFDGQLASGWDGTIDYAFIDSYGHLAGVRPALDADNFVFTDQPLAPFDATPLAVADGSRADRRAQVTALRQQLATAVEQSATDKRELEALLINGPFPLAYGMSEGTPHNVKLQRRGEPDQPGPEVARGFIVSLGGGSLPPETTGSGRRQLAEWLTRPENPLTARVMVNRIWQYHFGRGLVLTPNDFGVRGLPPTHPELLDHLAVRFVRGSWSVKAMHRLIMLSATYQQASLAGEPQTGTPELYSRFPRRRLSAEEVRDAILCVSGELDTSPALEHPFPSSINWGFTQHNPFSAVYDHNHRSVYLMTQRLKRHPFLALFDGADPNATTADRLITTVPTQALYFLNDPFVHAKAEAWALRLLSSGVNDPQRLQLAFQTAYGRPPTGNEVTDGMDFLASYRTEAAAVNLDRGEVRALAAYLRTLFGSNEFLHLD